MRFCAFALVVVAFVTESVAQASPGSWPQPGHDMQHSARNDYVYGPAAPVLRWRYDAQTFFSTSDTGVVDSAGNTWLLTGSNDWWPRLVSLDANGRLRFEYPLIGDPAHGPFLTSDGSAYVKSRFTDVNGYDTCLAYRLAGDGTRLWRRTTALGTGHLVSLNDALWAQDILHNIAPPWYRQGWAIEWPDGHETVVPTGDDSRGFTCGPFGDYTGDVLAIAAGSGSTDPPRLYRLGSDGNVIKSTQLDRWVAYDSALPLPDQTLFASGFDSYPPHNYVFVCVLDGSGRELARSVTGSNSNGHWWPLGVGRDASVVCTSGAGLCMYGGAGWCLPSVRANSVCIDARGTVYAREDHRIVAISRDGIQLWEFPFEDDWIGFGHAWGPVLTQAGLLFGTTDGWVYSLEAGGSAGHEVRAFVELDGLTSTASPPPILYWIREAGTSRTFVASRATWDVGRGCYPLAAPPGTVDIVVKADRWLSAKAVNVGESSTDVSLFCPGGDANGDDVVDLLDLSSVLADFGATGTDLDGDVNGDGKVNLLDLSRVLANFGMVGEGR